MLQHSPRLILQYVLPVLAGSITEDTHAAIDRVRGLSRERRNIRHFGFGWLDFLRTVARPRIAGALVPTLISIALFRLV
jgi:hypothetical protein